MFGGKGKFVNFYDTGKDLFDVMVGLEKKAGVKSFFIMDENFLFHKKRALELLDLMKKGNKPWSLYVFSSANVLRLYTMDQLIELGISWVWMGLEGKNSKYNKLDGINTFDIIKQLQDNGIRVLGSTIIGMEEHTPDNIEAALDYAVAHNTDFHQFMLYTPLPGTPLFEEAKAKNLMHSEKEFDFADYHGQYRFNYKHPNFNGGEEEKIIVEAFKRDFDVNGPSIIRIARTVLKGWTKYKNHPDPRVRSRYKTDASGLSTTYSAALWAAEKWFRYEGGNPSLARKLAEVKKEFNQKLGLFSRLFGAVAGRFVLKKMLEENELLKAGALYEPPTFYERNYETELKDGMTLLSVVEPAAAYEGEDAKKKLVLEPATAAR
jgi:hypothetical protein